MIKVLKLHAHGDEGAFDTFSVATMTDSDQPWTAFPTGKPIPGHVLRVTVVQKKPWFWPFGRAKQLSVDVELDTPIYIP